MPWVHLINSWGVLLFLPKGFVRNRDAKPYKRANNVPVKFFLFWVRFEPNFMLSCCMSQFCSFWCNFFLHILQIHGTLWHFLALFGSLRPFTLLCKFTFVAIYTLFWVKFFLLKPCISGQKLVLSGLELFILAKLRFLALSELKFWNFGKTVFLIFATIWVFEYS